MAGVHEHPLLEASMKAHFAVSALTVAVLAGTASATMRYDPISLTRTSPSVATYGSNASTIYGLATNIGQGYDVAGVGPILHIPNTDFGAMLSSEATGFDNVLDVSNNEYHGTNGNNAPNLVPVLYFSLSANSVGMAGTEINHQATRGQLGADRMTAGVSKSPIQALATGPAVSNHARLSINQDHYNAIPSISQHASFGGVQDDADGLEVTEFKFDGPNNQRTYPIFFNFDPQSPSMQPDNNVNHETWRSSDILVTPVGSQTPTVYAGASAWGGHADDVIDGLAVYDTNDNGTLDVGTDVAVMSLRAGSPTLTANGWTGGDMLVTNFSGTAQLYTSHVDMGLLATDEIDGLDVDYRDGTPLAYGLVVSAIPEPTTLALLAGIGVLALRRR
jgi:hypothetical protein